jgi:sigma-B regulation protein RsbU (phosphoserine phosphatase)
MEPSENKEPDMIIDRLNVAIGIESRLEKVPLARGVLGCILRELGVPESDTILLQLAVTELVNNSIEHGYKSEPGKKIEIFLTPGEQEILIEVADDAPAMPLYQMNQLLKLEESEGDAEEVDDQWSARGHGLLIVRRAVDSVEFGRVNGRNLVTLRKQFGESLS